MKFFIIFYIFLLFTGCQTTPKKSRNNEFIITSKHNQTLDLKSKINYKVDRTTHQARFYNDRIKFIVLHYTVSDDEGSIRTLTNEQVSSHYLVTTKTNDPIFGLVPDDKRAWHAGISNFKGKKNLNDTSIGIEIVNLGFKQEGNKLIFYPYDNVQMTKVALLLKNLVKKYNIDPTNVIGHSDCAPDRKWDPGPLFPWKQLHLQYGIGAWYNESTKNKYMNKSTYNKYSIRKIQEKLKKYGYSVVVNGKWDTYNKKVVRAFQLHFNPNNISGTMDLETFAILMALSEKYN